MLQVLDLTNIEISSIVCLEVASSPLELVRFEGDAKLNVLSSSRPILKEHVLPLRWRSTAGNLPSEEGENYTAWCLGRSLEGTEANPRATQVESLPEIVHLQLEDTRLKVKLWTGSFSVTTLNDTSICRTCDACPRDSPQRNEDLWPWLSSIGTDVSWHSDF